ncbi:activating transcription factor 7-interacting protein 2 [Channa argus]|uniref:activating transcription factor 7-interacting protein 2 n=1 Tax=Channa argus TaxID=215402 RepID=UPI003521C881
MKRLPSSPASSGAGEQKIGFSQSEVQKLIKEEIHSAIKSNETKLQGLIESVQQLACGVDCDRSIHKLEARINMVTKKAEAALAYLTRTQKKTPLPSLVNVHVIGEDSGDDLVNTTPQNKKSMNSMDKDGELLQMMETTKKALKRMRADNEALTAAIADLSDESPPPVLTPYGSPNCKGLACFIKKEPKDEQEKENDTKELKQFEEPKTKRMKVEHISSDRSQTPKHPGPAQQEKLSYPPLPSTTFPSPLKMEATSYNLPQRPEVHLALIREPPGLSVLWKVEKEDPCAPPMDSYTVYMTTEKVKGSGVFPDWKIIGEVKAITLPMCVMITKYKLGHKLCVAVVGKDTFGRYGPYSKVVSAAIPD